MRNFFVLYLAVWLAIGVALITGQAAAFSSGDMRVPTEEVDAVIAPKCIDVLTRPGNYGTFPLLPTIIIINNCEAVAVFEAVSVEGVREVRGVVTHPEALRMWVYSKTKIALHHNDFFKLVFKKDGVVCANEPQVFVARDKLKECRSITVAPGDLLEIPLPAKTAYRVSGHLEDVEKTSLSIQGKMLDLRCCVFK